MGVDGERQSVVDNLGREREVLGIKEAIPGKNLQLTIDLDLQVVAELALGDRRGSVVALDPNTGEILAMASHPTFDPEQVRGPHQDKGLEGTHQRSGKSLARTAPFRRSGRPVRRSSPSSRWRASKRGSIDEDTTFSCPGGASFYGHYYACWGHHGSVSLHKGITQSCDSYFYNVGNKTGIDNLAFYAHQAGLGAQSGIDLPNEASGTVPSPEWKLRNFRQKWFAGETISVAIGQGATDRHPAAAGARHRRHREWAAYGTSRIWKDLSPKPRSRTSGRSVPTT